MPNTYLISDSYYKEQFPEDRFFDSEIFYSTVLIKQNTSVQDVLGETLYSWLLNNANSTTLTTDQAKLLSSVQYLLVFFTKKGILELSSNDNDTIVEKRLSSLNGEILFLKSKLKKFISTSTDIQGLINGDSTYNGEQIYNSPIIYWKDIQ